MSYEHQMNNYEISIGPTGTEGWQNIPGLSYEISATLNELVKEKYPLDVQDLKRIKAILEAYVKSDADYVYGLSIAEQNEIEGRLIIMQINSQQLVEEVNKNPKEILWSNVMATGLASQNEKKFDRLIKENMDRVEFVRDGTGLRDFLFLSQDGVGDEMVKFDCDVFAVIDSDVDPSDDYEMQEYMLLRDRNTNEAVILKQLKEFFANTKRTLYVGIGFEENLQIDPLTAIKKAMGKEVSRYQEAKERQFPVWYKTIAEMPEDKKYVSKKAERFVKEFLDEEEKTILKNELLKMEREDLVQMIDKI